MIRLLIVDNQPSVRKGLEMMLAAEPDLCVIGEATDGAAALDLATLLRPDIVLLDVDMPRLDGLATASALRSVCPQAAVIILSFRDDVCAGKIAADVGAAFVAKSLPAATLLTAIRQVACQPRGGSIPPVLPHNP